MRREYADMCCARECGGDVWSPFSFICGLWWGNEVDKCCGRVYVGRDGGVDDLWIVGGEVKVDAEVVGVVIVSVRCDSRC